MRWEVVLAREVEWWLNDLAREDPRSYEQVVLAIDYLADMGPTLGRPMVDRIKGSTQQNLKELRPGSSGRSELRILFIFDPRRAAVLLVAGNKQGNWKSWYRKAIPLAETRYREYLAEDLAGDGR